MKNIIKLGLWSAIVLLSACSDGESTIPAPIEQKPDEPIVNPPENGENPTHEFLMGSLFSFQKNLRNGVDAANGGTNSTTFYNKPLFEAKDFNASDEEWWDNLVEEFVYSGLDYVAPNCRGRLPKAGTDSKYYVDHGDPTRIKDLIAAMKRRGVENLKIAIFDDCPASWAAARNLDLYGEYVTVLEKNHQVKHNLTDEQMRYPLENLNDIYKYIWDYNIKLAFENFYGTNVENNKYLLRYNNKPVLYLWSINGFLNVDYAKGKIDCTDKLKIILDKLHADFKNTFGEDVFLCVDKAFNDRDKKVDQSVVESMNNWFIASEQAADRNFYSLRSMNGVNVGVAVPGFLTNDKSGSRMLFDADHGKTLTTALDAMVKGKANMVLLEGFTDMAENAAYWRSTDKKYYDFPNQRLNILRKYSSKAAYPKSFRVEVEACDEFNDKSQGNSGRQYRKGDLDVKKCNDGFNGWCVTATEAGEWLKWKELPYCSGKSVILLRYASQAAAKLCFDIGSEKGKSIDLPATNGSWQEREVATVTFEKNGWYETTLNILSGDVDLNCFTIVSAE